MQLKTVGESLNVGDVIKDVTEKCAGMKGTFNEAAAMGFKLGDATKGFSLEAVKAALSQTNLNENVIRGVLAQQGLKDELLETATKEVMAAASAKKLGESEGIAAVFTKNLKDALRGLGKGLKELALFLTTNPIGWIIDVIGAVVAISAIYKKFTTSAKEAREALDNSLTSSANKVKEVREQKETVDQLAESYEKLSKGVNTSTNQNITLSTDSYKEYLDVCNQIADLYPDLVTGYDSQGNAILSLKGNVDQLTESYKQAQQEAYAMAYLGEKDEDGNYSGGITEAKRLWEYNSSKMSKTDNFWTDTSYAQSLFNTKNSQLEEAKNLLSMNDEDFKKEFNSLVTGNTTILSEFGISIDKMGELTSSKIQDFKSKIQLFVNDTQETMNDSVSDIAKTLEGYMKGITDASGSALASGYDKLTEEQQNFATSLLSSLDLDTLQAFENSGDFEGAAKKWVDNLVSSVSNMSATAKNAYDKLQDSIANPDNLTSTAIENIDGYLDTLSSELNISKDKLKEIFNLDDIFDTQTSFDNIVKQYLGTEEFDKLSSGVKKAADSVDEYGNAVKEAGKSSAELFASQQALLTLSLAYYT